LPYLNTKRASLELIQSKTAALLINLRLQHRCTNDAFWATDNLPKAHEWAEQQSQRFKEKFDQSFHLDK
jgi:hypothetical protein